MVKESRGHHMLFIQRQSVLLLQTAPLYSFFFFFFFFFWSQS